MMFTKVQKQLSLDHSFGVFYWIYDIYLTLFTFLMFELIYLNISFFRLIFKYKTNIFLIFL